MIQCYFDIVLSHVRVILNQLYARVCVFFLDFIGVFTYGLATVEDVRLNDI